jgi:hypothetical protein
MSDTLSFDDAIKASGSSPRTVLLGNGFSIAQAGGQFAYESLLEQSGLAETLWSLTEITTSLSAGILLCCALITPAKVSPMIRRFCISCERCTLNH